jgi:MFS family permease
MPLLPTIGRTIGTGVKGIRMLVRGSVRGGAWATRTVGTVRARGAANEVGMVRLFDLHAISCAGDALIAIGLAGTIFFNVPLGEARSKVALYLLITMVPFALLAPVIGPLLDHFRHGRRYALAVTMLGRAFLAWMISDNLHGWQLYPAVFGVLALSRAYGVARSAAVPRLLPEGVGLSQVGARASVYGTFAGAVVAPLGLAAFWLGPQWPLRVAGVIFIVGMVIALRLPPRADSEPPEAVPHPIRAMLRLGRGADRPITGKLIVGALIGSATLRFLYGFVLVYYAFVIAGGDLDSTVLGKDIGNKAAVGLVAGSLVVGTFLATAIGTRLRIRRPLALQSAGLVITAAAGVLATVAFNLLTAALFALVAAIFSGIAKLAIDASIQERVPERLRASAFGHSETVLIIAWVVGGAVGIIPLGGRLGVGVAAAFAVLAAVRAVIVAGRLHNERLAGRPDAPAEDPAGAGPAGPKTAGGGPEVPADPWPDAPTVPPRTSSASPTQRRPTQSRPTQGSPADAARGADPTLVEPPAKGRSGWRRRSKGAEAQQAAPPADAAPSEEAPPPIDPALAPPGYHIYRPSSATSGNGNDPGDT